MPKIDKEKRAREAQNKLEVKKCFTEQDISEVFCGIKYIQFLARREIYLVVYCIVGFVIGMFFTYSVATISTLEKRFKLSSKLTGVMLSGNDISQVLLAMWVSYYGNYGNRPKWLGTGILTASFACFLAAVPHFYYGPGIDAINVASSSLMNAQDIPGTNMSSESNPFGTGLKNEVCNSSHTGDCLNEDFTNYGAVIILFVAQFIVGLAVSVFYTLGLAYLDDNVNKRDTPVYYAISMIVRIAGPVLGFLLASKCLSIYIDPRYEPNISLRDPRWLGAWWLGYIVLSILLAICAFLMFLFPRTLPNTMVKLMQKEQDKENTKVEINKYSDFKHLLELVNTSRHKIKPSLKELPKALKRLFRNKIWIGFQFNAILDLLALMGYWSFKPKYLEYQFRMSATKATFYTGVAGLVSSVVGLGLSGFILKIFRPNARFISGYSCFLTLFNAATLFSLMFISCPQIHVIGPDYHGDSTLSIDCNTDCECSDRYAPVCSKNGLDTYYSPCYAGCTQINATASPVEYYDCQCIAPMNDTSSKNDSETDELYGRAVQGYCPETCQSFFYYIIATIISKVISSSGRIGGTLLYLRSVAEHDKGIALGTTTMLISLFAFIPGPIIMGAIVDNACIIWDNTCGEKGNCWLYDSDKFRIMLHAVPAAMILLALGGDILVFLNSKGIDIYGEKDEIKPDPEESAEELKSLQKKPTSVENPEEVKLIHEKETKEQSGVS